MCHFYKHTRCTFKPWSPLHHISLLLEVKCKTFKSPELQGGHRPALPQPNLLKTPITCTDILTSQFSLQPLSMLVYWSPDKAVLWHTTICKNPCNVSTISTIWQNTALATCPYYIMPNLSRMFDRQPCWIPVKQNADPCQANNPNLNLQIRRSTICVSCNGSKLLCFASCN